MIYSFNMQLQAQQQTEIYVILQADHPQCEKRKLISSVIIVPAFGRQVLLSREVVHDESLH